MLPADSFPELAELPFHVQLMFTVIIGSGVICLAVVAMGALVGRIRRAGPLAGLPPLPRHFPYPLDQVYTALFTIVLLGGAVAGLLPAAALPEEQVSITGVGTLLLSIIIQAGIYLPMLLRYAYLHRWQPAERPRRQYITRPLLYWGLIYLSVVFLEVSGFTPWLIRASGCPEHQELVLLFSRGELFDKLYIIICAVFIAPLAEECCFRGFLYTSLRHWGGRIAATLASALLFGAIHGSLAQMIPLTIFGIFQCIAYEEARSLWLPVAVHMLFNTTSLIATALMLP